ncbi:hypothetical protein AA313_de0205184 [Arthrobotrys entomopaga]|nr:hypothetical protein AA313_de0205184 [Arthrobotrys entomopaga]
MDGRMRRRGLVIRKFTEDHEWVEIDTETRIATIGITEYAQEKLGDVVFIELPEIGRTVEQEESVGAVESVKSASDILSPVSGTVAEVNEELNEEPKLVNQDAEDAGWIVKLEVDETALEQLNDLMDAEGYEAHVKS